MVGDLGLRLYALKFSCQQSLAKHEQLKHVGVQIVRNTVILYNAKLLNQLIEDGD
jgi:hypothetical protein